MTAKTKSVRRPTLGNSSQIHIPHSSWARVDRTAGSPRLLKAEDFWSRLGL